MDSKVMLGISRTLGALRKELDYSDMPAQMIQIFLEVAAPGEIGQNELEEKVGISKAAISRFLGILSEGTPSKPGLQLLQSYEDPYDRRWKRVRVTTRGRKVAARVVKAMGK